MVCVCVPLLLIFCIPLFLIYNWYTSTTKSQFAESLWWLPYENINFYLGIDDITLFLVILTTFFFSPYLHFSGLVWYEKFWEIVYYSIFNLWISNDQRVLHARSSTNLCSSWKHDSNWYQPSNYFLFLRKKTPINIWAETFVFFF